MLFSERNLILKKGTIVDSIITAVPSFTKNREKKRDPDAHQTKKGNTWHFAYKAHIGVDKDSGLAHALEATSADVNDVTMTTKLLTGEETSAHGDIGYLGAEKRDDTITKTVEASAVGTNQPSPVAVKKHSVRFSGQIKRREREKSSVCAKVEHVFHGVKGQLRFRKTRYRGLQKQPAKFNVMFALAKRLQADRLCLSV